MVPGQRAGSGKAAAGFRSPRAFGRAGTEGWQAHSVPRESCDGSQQSRAFGCLFGGDDYLLGEGLVRRAGRAHSVRPESCDGSQQSRACGCLFGGMSGGGAVVDGVDEAAEAAVVAAVRGEDEAREVGEGFLVGFLGEGGALGDGAGLDEV